MVSVSCLNVILHWSVKLIAPWSVDSYINTVYIYKHSISNIEHTSINIEKFKICVCVWRILFTRNKYQMYYRESGFLDKKAIMVRLHCQPITERRGISTLFLLYFDRSKQSRPWLKGLKSSSFHPPWRQTFQQLNVPNFRNKFKR